VDNRTHRIFVLSSSSQYFDGSPAIVDVVDATTGRVLRTVRVGHNAGDVVADEQTGRIVVTTILDHAIHLLNASSGAMVRKAVMPYDISQPTVDAHSGRIFLTGGTVGALGASSLIMIDGTTGDILNVADHGLNLGPCVVDQATERIFCSDGTFRWGWIVTYDAQSGSFLGSESVSGSAPDALTVNERAGRIFMSSGAYDEGYSAVNIVDARSGTVVRAVTVDPLPQAFVVNSRTGHILAIGGGKMDASGPKLRWIGPGYVRVLDGVTGAELRQVPIAYHAPGGHLSAAIDEQTNRLFIANDEDRTVSVLDVAQVDPMSSRPPTDVTAP
jgi:DNA-binding beta-propeller fold protein YncE